MVTVVKKSCNYFEDPEGYVHHRDLCVGYHIESTPHGQKRSEMGMPILTLVSLPACSGCESRAIYIRWVHTGDASDVFFTSD